MALIKIYSEHSLDEVAAIARLIKLVCAAALNCPTMPTNPSQVETVMSTGLDLVGIDYILEVVGCERPDMQGIGDAIIAGLNAVYPEKFFSVYFNLISEAGMSATLRQRIDDEPISMAQAIEQAK